MLEHYEIVYIVPVATYTDAEATEAATKLTTLLTTLGGLNLKTTTIGKRRLAYPIKQVHQGFYVVVEFDCEREQIKNIDKEFRFHDDVLRHLLIQKDVKTAEQLAREQKAKEKVMARAEAEMQAAHVEKQKERVATTPVAPKPQPVVEAQPATPATIEEIDKKLDAILDDNMDTMLKNV